MAPQPSSTLWLFLLTVAGVAGLLGWAAWASKRPGTGLLIGVIWLGVPGALACFGLLDSYDPPSPPVLLMVAMLTLGTVALARSRFGGALASGVGLAGLVGFQVFRIPVEWVLHRLFVEGVIPVQMTYAGYNFDIVSGITAAALGLYLRGGVSARRLVLAWNTLGLLLLANIVIIAAVSTPSALRLFPDDPANRLIGAFPYVWLPSFLVQAALFGHLLVFRALRNPGGSASG